MIERRAMRVLLVNGNRERSPLPVMPLGLCAVASGLEAAGFEVRVVDLTFARRPAARVAAEVRRFRPEAVGVSIRNIDDGDSRRRRFHLAEVRRDAIEPVRREAPGVPLVLGGSAVGIAPEGILRYTGADYAVAGDGERAARRLFEALRDGRDAAAIPGVARREGHAVVASPPDRIEDLDDLPLARAYRWIDWPRYAACYGAYGIQTKRGCDRTCTYCTYPLIEGRCYRLRDPARVADEVQDAFENGGVTSFEFVDSVFNVPRAHAVAVCREVARRRLPVKLDTLGLNPGEVDRELVEAMVAAGFTEITCTPESGSDAVLAGLGKRFTASQAAEAARLLGEVGLPTKWCFLFGGPGETEATVRETFAFIDRCLPRRDLVVAMTGIRILPRTGLAEVARAEGVVAPDDDLLEPRFYFGTLGEARLKALVAREVARRPNCCHVSGEIWSVPLLVRAHHAWCRIIGRDFTRERPRWGLIPLLHRVLRAWRSP